MTALAPPVSGIWRKYANYVHNEYNTTRNAVQKTAFFVIFTLV